MSRLSEEKKNHGKTIPIFAVIENDYKIFGAFTLNSGGSVSFFPDFHNLDNFDHLTLNGNFIEKKGHLTKVTTSASTKSQYILSQVSFQVAIGTVVSINLFLPCFILPQSRKIPRKTQHKILLQVIGLAVFYIIITDHPADIVILF